MWYIPFNHRTCSGRATPTSGGLYHWTICAHLLSWIVGCKLFHKDHQSHKHWFLIGEDSNTTLSALHLCTGDARCRLGSDSAMISDDSPDLVGQFDISSLKKPTQVSSDSVRPEGWWKATLSDLNSTNNKCKLSLFSLIFHWFVVEFSP